MGVATTQSAVCALDVLFAPTSFTGKERDAESGNDYFGARCYSSSMGRFLSPDWSDESDPVPYANFDNPQSLNLYAFVDANPLSNTDTDGHSCNTNFSGENESGKMVDYGGYCDLDSSDGFSLAEGIQQPGAPRDSQVGALLYPNATFQVSAVDPGNCDMRNVICQMQYEGLTGPIRRIPQASAPSNGQSYSYFKQWLKDLKSCFVDTGLGTIANQMDPFTPSASNAVQGAVDTASQAALAGAAVHSVERGLTVPLRSSIVRAGAGTSEALGEASGWITLASLYVGIGKAYAAEWKQCGW